MFWTDINLNRVLCEGLSNPILRGGLASVIVILQCVDLTGNKQTVCWR